MESKTQPAIQAAMAWVREHIFAPAKTVIGDVEVNAKTIKDSFSHTRYQNKYDAVQAIVPVLEKGTYLGTLPDKDGKSIDNYYFAGRVRIGGEEKIVFARVLQHQGRDIKKFYVHEVFTEEEIEKSKAFKVGEQGTDLRYSNASDFYKSLLAGYLNVKGESTQEKNEEPKASSGQQSDDRLVTAFSNEQHIPSLRPDEENPQSFRLVVERHREDVARWMPQIIRDGEVKTAAKAIRYEKMLSTVRTLFPKVPAKSLPLVRLTLLKPLPPASLGKVKEMYQLRLETAILTQSVSRAIA